MQAKTVHAWMVVSGAVVVTGLCIGSYLCLSQGPHRGARYRGPLEKITLAAYAGDAATLVYLGEAKGYFEEKGLEVTIVDYGSGKAAADALIAGESQICTSAGSVFVSNSFDYPDLRVFGTVATAEVKELVARRDKGISSTDDLKGKRIGVTRRSGAEFCLARFLTLKRLSMHDVELVDLRPSEIVQGISDGDIDAACTWDPNVYEMKKALGDNAVSWPAGQAFYFVLMAKQDWLERNPGPVERFVKAVVKAEKYVKENSEKSKQFVEDRFDYGAAYLNYSWPKQDFAVILEQAMLLAFEDQARWRISNKLTEATEVPNYLAFMYVEALQKVKPLAADIVR